MHRGFIKFWRKIDDWEWINNPNVLVVFFHCVRLANFKEKKWQGVTIKRGSFITSYEKLANVCGLSVHRTRTALDKLKASELAIKTTNKYTVISINNYSEYNDSGKQMANKWQTNGKQMATTKEYKKDKNIKRLTGIDKSLKDELPKDKLVLLSNKYHLSLQGIKDYKESYILWIKQKPTDKNRQNRSMSATVEAWIKRDLKSKNVKKEGQFL